jgi:hypothetical protein
LNPEVAFDLLGIPHGDLNVRFFVKAGIIVNRFAFPEKAPDRIEQGNRLT